MHPTLLLLQYVSLGGSAENSNSQHMLSASQQILLEMSERVSTGKL